MLELVVTIAITSTLFALLLPWVLNLIGVSSANLDAATVTRTAASLERSLDKDFAHAVTCPATGTPIAFADATRFALFTATQDGAPGVQLAVWSLLDGQMSRAAAPATVTAAECRTTDPGADPVGDPSTVTWAPYADRVTVTGSPSGALQMFTEAPVGRPALVRVDLTVAGADGTSAPVPVSASYKLTALYAGLT